MKDSKLQECVTWSLSKFCKEDIKNDRPVNKIQPLVWQAIELEGFTHKEVDEETEYQVKVLREFMSTNRY